MEHIILKKLGYNTLLYKIKSIDYNKNLDYYDVCVTYNLLGCLIHYPIVIFYTLKETILFFITTLKDYIILFDTTYNINDYNTKELFRITNRTRKEERQWL